MWIRTRLDVSFRDVCWGLWGSLTLRDRAAAQVSLERYWSNGKEDALACLSVRSGFDLLLQALDLSAGSEVLYSAVTIPDMVQVAKSHGLVPVPIDLCGSDFHVDPNSLKRAITPQSKLLIVAHLFGARPDIAEICDVARENNLMIVEDCAQAWCNINDRGCDTADVSLFSFGTIKTATAFGGALARVRSESVLARMREIQATYPVQSQTAYAVRLPKFALLKAISTRFAFGTLVGMGKRFGMSVDGILARLTAGFPDGELMPQLRYQPCSGLLKLLHHRLKTHDVRRIDRRIENARRIIQRLDLCGTQPQLDDRRHTFWLFPYQTDDADALKRRLWQHGFDSTQRGRLEVVPPPADRPELRCSSAATLLEQTLFLPCYSEMPANEIIRMCDVINHEG